MQSPMVRSSSNSTSPAVNVAGVGGRFDSAKSGTNSTTRSASGMLFVCRDDDHPVPGRELRINRSTSST